ncbi:MAG: hypothetical protein RMN24_03645, partial [Anaerolineae bacterium]|nr:hypothetical protein [Anaerolineae bacterium]
ATATPTPTPPVTPTPSGQTGQATFEKALVTGWNAFSIPVVPPNPLLPTVLSSIEGRYTVVRWWDNTVTPPRWRSYRPGDPASDLIAIPELIGVWIEMNQPGLLRVTGARPTTTVIHLEPGWNQIGFPALTPQRVEMTLAAIAGRYDRVRVWDNAQQLWREFRPNDPASTLTVFQPGDAIWIHATQPADLTIVN